MNYAIRKRETILHEIGIGTFNYAKHFPDSKSLAKFGMQRIPYVNQLLTDWLNNAYRTCEQSTYKAYNSVVQHHLIPYFGDMLVSELKTADINAFITGLTVSRKHVNNILIPLRGMLGDAFIDELIDRDPMDRIKNLPHRTREPEPFDPDEINLILEHSDGQVRNLFEFAFWTGLRTSELMALEWRDVDWANNRIHVRRAKVLKQIKSTKTRAGERAVLLLPPAMKALTRQKEYLQDRVPQVFINPATDQPWLDDQQIRKSAWIPTLMRAGIPYRPPYQTRHTFASMLLSAGETPMWVASQLGHANCGMVLTVYARWIPAVGGAGGGKLMALWSQLGHGGDAND